MLGTIGVYRNAIVIDAGFIIHNIVDDDIIMQAPDLIHGPGM